MASTWAVIWLFVATLNFGMSQVTKQETEECRSTLFDIQAKMESRIDEIIGAIEDLRARQRAGCVLSESTTESVTRRGAFNCTVNVQAASSHDPCTVPQYGLLRLNGLTLWIAAYCVSYPIRRGVTVLDINPFSCQINGVRQFDTWASSSHAVDLSIYMQNLRDGAVLIGVIGDEPTQHLQPVMATMRAAGIFVGDVPYRGNFAFVTQKGFAYKTRTSQGDLVSPARIDVQLTGTSLDDLKFAAIQQPATSST